MQEGIAQFVIENVIVELENKPFTECFIMWSWQTGRQAGINIDHLNVTVEGCSFYSGLFVWRTRCTYNRFAQNCSSEIIIPHYRYQLKKVKWMSTAKCYYYLLVNNNLLKRLHHTVILVKDNGSNLCSQSTDLVRSSAHFVTPPHPDEKSQY